MKIFYILFFIFFLHVEAQRRTQTRQDATNADTPVRGRGRSRFTNTETSYSQPSETPSRRIPSRRRQEPSTPAPVEKPNYPTPSSSTQSYAVEEHIDEGDAPKLKDLPEPNFEPQFIPSKSAESEVKSSERRSSAETSAERYSEEQGIPTVKIDTDGSSLFREEDAQPKLNERVIPITRNNVRTGASKEVERRMDVRNGGSRNGGNRGSRNGNTRNTNDNTIPVSRNGASRSRNSNDIPPRRTSVIEDSGPIYRQEPPSEIPAPRAENPILTNKISDLIKDENEIRKEIVRNSVPKLPPPIGIASILSEPPLPKKTVKKTIKTRVNTHSRNEEAAIPTRARSNQRVVENFETAPRVASRTVEEFGGSSRGRSASPLNEDSPPVRTRSNATPRTIEASTLGRSRTRATRKPAETVQTVTIPSRRGGRRRTESATTSAIPPRRSPSVFSTAEESPSSRSRTGRKIEAEVPKAPTDSKQNTRQASSRWRSRVQASPDQIGSSSNRRQTLRSSEHVTRPPRQRFNARSPPNIDESKLEVLPLFEGETKIISESGRKPNQLDQFIPSENEVRVINPPENATPSISTSSDVSTSSKVSSVKVTSRRKMHRKQEVKESVVSQVTEVTSKRTITRKPIARPGGKRLTTKKSLETKFNGLTSSEEDISASDNYPEPFKALLQSKKHEKESRPSNVPEEDTKTKKIESVSSSVAPRSVLASPKAPTRTTTSPLKYVEDLENEVQPKAPTTSTTYRPTKKRLSPSFKNLELKNKKYTTTPVGKTVSRSTLAPAKEPKDHKFHSKFSSVSKKPLNSVPSKGLSFNRKSKENDKYSTNKTRNAADVGNNRGQSTSAPLHKSSRYSSRYRSGGSSRTVARSSTAPPAYIPTIPSVRSYSATEYAGL